MIKNIPFFATLFLILLLTACQTAYVNVQKLPINHETLASTFARSPDPLQKRPLNGERLYVSWSLPYSLSYADCKVELSIIYKDLTEEKIDLPIKKRSGHFAHTLLGEEYEKTKGFFAYKALLKDPEGNILDSWEHQMWVNILKNEVNHD